MDIDAEKGALILRCFYSESILLLQTCLFQPRHLFFNSSAPPQLQLEVMFTSAVVVVSTSTTATNAAAAAAYRLASYYCITHQDERGSE